MFSLNMLASYSRLYTLSLSYRFSSLWAFIKGIFFLFFFWIWWRGLLCRILLLIKTFSFRVKLTRISGRSRNRLPLVVYALWMVLVASTHEHFLLINECVFSRRYLIYLIFYLLKGLCNVKSFCLQLWQILNILCVILVHKLKWIAFIHGWNLAHIKESALHLLVGQQFHVILVVLTHQHLLGDLVCR